MKLLLLIPLLIYSTCAVAQEKTFPHPFEFKLVDSTNATKEELFTRARAWLAKELKSSWHALQMDDKEAGKIVCKAHFSFPIEDGFGDLLCNSPINFTLSIDVKENRYRIILTEFSHGSCFTGHHTTTAGGSLDSDKPVPAGMLSMPRNQWKKIKTVAIDESEAILISFHKAMNQASTNGDGF